MTKAPQKTKTLVFKGSEARFEVLLMADPFGSIRAHCSADAPLETGGILIGTYHQQGQVAQVREATGPPNDSKKTRSTFERGTDGLAELLEHRWRAERRSYYIGEWHCHTVPSCSPSGRDRSQMKTIANESKHQCPEPILIIVGRGAAGIECIRCFVFPKGEKMRELGVCSFDEDSHQPDANSNISIQTQIESD